MITVGELRLGVPSASDDGVRALRLRTLARALSFDPLPVDDSVATAIAHQLPLVTQDDDYDDVPGLEIVKL